MNRMVQTGKLEEYTVDYVYRVSFSSKSRFIYLICQN